MPLRLLLAEHRLIAEGLEALLRVWGYAVVGVAADGRQAVDLAESLRPDVVTRGAVYLSPGISRAFVGVSRAGLELPDDRLTAREREVLQLVAESRTTKEIASILGVSVKTADSHRTNLMQKLGIHETAGLVRYAIRRGLVQP